MSDTHPLANPRRLPDGRVCCSESAALCDACKVHHGTAFRAASPYEPPDPYAAGLARLREAKQ
jgi:hypothetical protein